MSMYEEPMNKFTGNYEHDLNNQLGKLNPPISTPPTQIYRQPDAPAASIPIRLFTSVVSPSDIARTARGSYSAANSVASAQSSTRGGSSGIGWVVLVVFAGLIGYGFLHKPYSTPETKVSTAPPTSDNLASPNVPGPNPPSAVSQANNETSLPDTQPISDPLAGKTELLDGNLSKVDSGPVSSVPLSMSTYLSTPNANADLLVPGAELRIPGARHQVTLGKDCHGELVFTYEAFRFDCIQGNRSDGLFVEWGAVAKVDKNGVQLSRGGSKGDKYHFAVDGVSNDVVHNLFSKWFER